MAPLSVQNATAAIPTCVSITAHDGTILCAWANNPDTRGTLNILWLCVSTLGLCVWNAVHPDVPYPGTPKWRVIRKRVWWLFVGLFMPELLVLTALGQLQLAYRLLVRVSRETRVPTTLPWWLVRVERFWPTPLTGHEIEQHDESLPLLVSGGAKLPPSSSVELEHLIAVRPARASEPEASLSTTPSRPRKDAAIQTERARCVRKHPWTLTHSFYAVMHGFLGADGDAFWTTEKNRGGNLEPVFDARKGIQRLIAASDNTCSIPDISVDELDDRSKADVVAKTLLIWQFSVFIANCAARWDQNLPLSLLEITTLAHSLCSLVALGLWWYKPNSVSQPTVIDRTQPLPPRQDVIWFITARSNFKVVPGDDYIDIPRMITVFGIAVLYGLPHLLGFSVHFSSAAFEKLLWQMATIIVIGSPFVVGVIGWVVEYRVLGRRMEEAGKVTLGLLALILVPFYVMASMCLVVESVRQVFALPEASFHEPQLTRYLPSFS